MKRLALNKDRVDYDVPLIRTITYLRRSAGVRINDSSTLWRRRREPSHHVRIRNVQLENVYTAASVKIHERIMLSRSWLASQSVSATRIYTTDDRRAYSTLANLIRHLNTKMAILGMIIQVSLLIVNAIAILNEERFLAKSKFSCKSLCHS